MNNRYRTPIIIYRRMLIEICKESTGKSTKEARKEVDGWIRSRKNWQTQQDIRHNRELAYEIGEAIRLRNQRKEA